MHRVFFFPFGEGIGEEAAGGGNKVGKMVGLVVLHSSSSLEDSELITGQIAKADKNHSINLSEAKRGQ